MAGLSEQPPKVWRWRSGLTRAWGSFTELPNLWRRFEKVVSQDVL